MSNPHEGEVVADPVTEAFNEYIGKMQIGDRKILAIEQFRNLMHAIHADFNPSENNSGVIEGDFGKYEYSREENESDVLVKRVG